MKELKSLKYEKITKNIILVEKLNIDDSQDFYLARAYHFWMDEEYYPIVKAKTKEECLKKGIEVIFNANLLFIENFNKACALFYHNKYTTFDLDDKFMILNLDEDDIEYFAIDENEIYISNGMMTIEEK